MMQRQSIARFNISFIFSTKADEEEEILHEDIASAEEFLTNYRNLCELMHSLPKDPFKTFKPTPYTIKVTGTLNSNKFEKVFSNIDTYHEFLLRHKLLPDPSNRPPIRF